MSCTLQVGTRGLGALPTPRKAQQQLLRQPCWAPLHPPKALRFTCVHTSCLLASPDMSHSPPSKLSDLLKTSVRLDLSIHPGSGLCRLLLILRIISEVLMVACFALRPASTYTPVPPHSWWAGMAVPSTSNTLPPSLVSFTVRDPLTTCLCLCGIAC